VLNVSDEMLLNEIFCVFVETELSKLRQENRKSMLVSVIILTAAVAAYFTFSSQ